MFDKDNSGKIDNEEVLALLAGEDLQAFVSKDAIGQAMKEFDENGDGEIDFEEFMAMMKNASAQWNGIKSNTHSNLDLRGEMLEIWILDPYYIFE